MGNQIDKHEIKQIKLNFKIIIDSYQNDNEPIKNYRSHLRRTEQGKDRTSGRGPLLRKRKKPLQRSNIPRKRQNKIRSQRPAKPYQLT